MTFAGKCGKGLEEKVLPIDFQSPAVGVKRDIEAIQKFNSEEFDEFASS